MALQGQPRSLILAPIESAYATFYRSSYVCCMTPPFQGTPANIRINLILSESLGYIVVTHCVVYLHSNFRGGLRKTHTFWNTERNGPSRSSKVVDFGTNRKHVCHFLFVINSNPGPILPRFTDIAGFLLRSENYPYSTRILGVFPLD